MELFAAKDLVIDAEHWPSIRARLDVETEGDYAHFRNTLKADYHIVWRDIALGYVALAAVLGLVALADGLWSGMAAAVLGAIGVGYAIAYLQLFIHEASHWQLADKHADSDRLANLFIAWHVGTSIAAYRRVHFLHHGHFGTDGDAERSYAHRLTWRLVAEMLTGIHALRIFLTRAKAGPKAGSGESKGEGKVPLLRGMAAHALILGGLVLAGAWPAALAWVGGMAIAFPFFATMRPLLEHRATEADMAYGLAGRDGITRMFRDGFLARTFGGAGFSRHLLHHWEPNISYTRLADLEAYLDRTSIRSILDARRTSYGAAFRAILAQDRPAVQSALVTSTQIPAIDAPCLACGSADTRYWATARDVEYASVAESFDYVICTACGTLSIANPPVDRLSEIYPANYYSFAGNGRSPVEAVKQWLDKRNFRKLFAQVEGQELSALDVGGGNGWLLTLAQSVEPRLKDTMVVDLDGAAEAAARAAGHEFHLGPVEGLQTQKRFDVIFMLNLIEHVADPEAVLMAMRGLLKPGGRIFVKTPNHDALDARLFRNASWGGLHCPRHWVIFTPESFRTCAERAGLEVESLSLTQGAPFWTVSALEWLGRKGLIRTGANRPMVTHPLFGPLTALFAAFDILRGPFSRTSQMFATLKVR